MSGPRQPLLPHHRDHLRASGISDAVIDARGYGSLDRRQNDTEPRDILRRVGFSSHAWKEDRRFPGILIPLYGPTGQRASLMYRPDHPAKDDRGRLRKYEAPRGKASVLDVHPLHVRYAADQTVPLVITEGVKKVDAIVTAGVTEGIPVCAVGISGVFGWRTRHGTNGAWEDVILKGRHVYLVFDADAATNPNVSRAMARAGQWLRSRGASKVGYVVTPGDGKAGADDYLAGGGTLRDLLGSAGNTPPDPTAGDDSLTDSRLAERLQAEVLADRYLFSPLLGGWHRWDGRVWRVCESDGEVVEECRRLFVQMLADAATAGASAVRQKALVGLQSAGRIRAVVTLAKSLEGVLVESSEWDEDPWLLNCGNGVVHLRTGELLPHDPDLRMTRVTAVDYAPGAEHPDWKTALGAVPDGAEEFLRDRLGQALVGHPPPDDRAVLLHGGGQNGKSTVLGGCQRALGGYSTLVPDQVLTGDPKDHPTEMMTLRGARLAVIEETPEARRLSVARLKKILGVTEITARLLYQNNVVFTTTHSLVVSTNYKPQVNETDHGTWRRLALVPFNRRYREPAEMEPGTLPADPGLRSRVRDGVEQHQAALAWLVAGAVAYFERGEKMLPLPQVVEEATRAWRGESDSLAEFLEENVVLDPGWHIPTVDLLSVFNDWLAERGHSRWSVQLLTSRLETHEWVERGPVRQDRVRAAGSSGTQPSRSAWGPSPSARYRAWTGVRWAVGGPSVP